jgi:hypothetical protein
MISLPPVRREWFADDRGRSLRVSWHEREHLVVCSLWDGERCIGTFHLDVSDTPRLTILLAQAIGSVIDGSSDASGAAEQPVSTRKADPEGRSLQTGH